MKARRFINRLTALALTGAFVVSPLLCLGDTVTVNAAERVLDITVNGPVAVNAETLQELSRRSQQDEASVNAGTGILSNGIKAAVVKSNPAMMKKNGATNDMSSLIDSSYGVLIDLTENRIIAEKNSDAQMYPASMTKVMTLLVAVESLSDLEEKLSVSQDIVDYAKSRGASRAGFRAGERVPVKDLLFGIILPSGADAVMVLARRAAGSDSAFVERMNEKARALGLSDGAEFRNATGLFDENHHMTVRDMAAIMAAAMQNDTARAVLTTQSYTTTPTTEHPDGIKLNNLFLQRIAGQDTRGSRVLAAKTGYVRQSMFCAVSCSEGRNGHQYILVTAHAVNSWQCIYDQAKVYATYVS